MHAEHKSAAELYRQHDTVGVTRVSQGELKNSAADALEGLGVPRHTKLNQLQLVSDELLGTVWKIPKFPLRASEPEMGRSTTGASLFKLHLSI
jgi:hypothetical protein